MPAAADCDGGASASVSAQDVSAAFAESGNVAVVVEREVVFLPEQQAVAMAELPPEAVPFPVSERGPRGLPGPAGGQILTAVTDGAIGGHRAIFVGAGGTAGYATAEDATAGAVAGITIAAAAAGETVSFQTVGELVEPSWSWTPEQTIYLGTAGTLTQSAPASGAVVQLGIALSSTRILIRIQLPIFLQ